MEVVCLMGVLKQKIILNLVGSFSSENTQCMLSVFVYKQESRPETGFSARVRGRLALGGGLGQRGV